MIGRLKGIIIEKIPPLVLIEASGVGYEVNMPMSCFYALPHIGQEAIIFTKFVIRKDTQMLYGFNNKQERMLFNELIQTYGIGPKLSLAILSSISTQKFINIIEHEAHDELIKLPGIGKKIAKRLIVEMKDRFRQFNNNLLTSSTDLMLSKKEDTSSNDHIEKEAITALVALGYKPKEAIRMVSQVAITNASREYLIREALRSSIM